ncbi:WD repeat-containing protein 93 isoform X3 [Brienomyrus brachyistius]|uniref:WD repeat-containing protein 93 isoform X3 n=1 Tax=Brienomyrus brachyistius TaxID=42636 RepID=UPI0020B31123|nr:WD repeat-containing protein 93 isoform X3 [Brienomyrus brachyistius]
MSTMKPRKLGGAKMPVYTRKDPKGIPEPWDSEDSADEERVPDLLHDSLPQPFRMIGKVLEGVLDAAWGVISEKEAARVAEQTRRKIPQVEFSDEIKKEINQRNNCTKIELSEGGNYAAVMMECNGDSWIEMNRFPKVSWLKELEGLHAASGNQVTNTSGTEVAKFSPVVTVLKIKTPDMLSGTSLKCPFEVLQKTACSSVIGSGQNHMISSQQWAEQRALYKLVHSKYLGTGTCEMEARARLGSLYFLLPGGLSTVTDGTRSLQGPPSAVYVWWRGDHNLYQYLLHTRAKEKTDDEAKPSEVWSNAQEIVCSAISRCTRHIALGLMGGLVAMWDRRLGLPWSVLSVPADSPFSKLHFLDCLPFPQDPFLPKMHFLVTCKNGDCRVITAGRGMDSQVTRLCGRPGDAEAPPTEVLSVHFLQMLVLLMYRNGTIVLLDTSDDIVVASLVLPPNHCLATPWSPVYTLDPVNQNLFVRGR